MYNNMCLTCQHNNTKHNWLKGQESRFANLVTSQINYFKVVESQKQKNSEDLLLQYTKPYAKLFIGRYSVMHRYLATLLYQFNIHTEPIYALQYISALQYYPISTT